MKKHFLLIIMLVAAISMNAQVFVENFATATIGSALEGYNFWYVCAKSTDNLGVSPKISEGALFYTGYAGSNIGNTAVLDPAIGSTSSNQRISTRAITFAAGDTLKPIAGQKIYAAFMINFAADSYTSQRDFFTFEGSVSSSSTRGRLFAKLTGGTDITFAISKNSSTSGVYVESALMAGAVGINHLIVMCYEGIAGDLNDIISVYIDPDLSKTEAAQTSKLTATDTQAQSDYSVSIPFRINLRQRGTSAKIGGIRVGKTWDEVVLGKFTGLHDISNANSVKIIGKQIITENAGEINVYNFAGSKILQAKTSGKIDTSLTRGLYLIKFTDIEGKISTTKALIN